MSTPAEELSKLLSGPVMERGQAGYDQEVAGFNAAIVHRPDLVVGAGSTADVVQAVRFARSRGWRVAVQSTGHGATLPFEGGLLVTTSRLAGVEIDAAARTARAGAGARWGAVVASSAPHRLAPIAGSSPTVGVVGFLLGGGVGPLVRSHGFGSDYLASATVVTGTGDLLRASADENPDVLWALRGGAPRLGIVTEIGVRLVELPALCAGSLFFEESHIEAALRGWVAFTAEAHPQVTTSLAIVRFPPRDTIPAPLRGRHLLTIRFAYPGEAKEGARLAAPLRAVAPVYMDMLDALPIADVARIFHDPPGPLPAWASGRSLAQIDQDFASALLRHAGPGANWPFLATEIRQLGQATSRDVPGGSAGGGRGASFTFALIGANPADFETILPQAEGRLLDDLGSWVSSEIIGNFAPHPSGRQTRGVPAGASTQAKLAELNRRYDPDGLFR
jgi:hypothetical protein